MNRATPRRKALSRPALEAIRVLRDPVVVADHADDVPARVEIQEVRQAAVNSSSVNVPDSPACAPLLKGITRTVIRSSSRAWLTICIS